MHIDVSTLGLGTEDYTSFSTWEAATDELRDRTHYEVLLVTRDAEDLTEEYRHILEWVTSYPECNRLVVTDTTVLAAGTWGEVKVFEPELRPDLFGTEVPSDPRGTATSLVANYLKTFIDQADPDQEHERSDAVSMLNEAWVSLVKLIAARPDELDKIEWRELEKVLAEALRGIGFDVELTPPSKDGGKDLILNCTTKDGQRSYYVEVKHWTSGKRVGNTLVRDFLDVVVRDKKDRGLFLATHGYSKGTLQKWTEVERRKIRLGDATQAVSVCQSYVRTAQGLMVPTSQLPEILFDHELLPEEQ